MFDLSWLLRPAPSLGRTAVNGFVVSTVDSPDEGYETAILDAKNAHPVERYQSETAAREGHKRWVKHCRRAGESLTVTKLGWQGGLVKDRKIKLRRMNTKGQRWKELRETIPNEK